MRSQNGGRHGGSGKDAARRGGQSRRSEPPSALPCLFCEARSRQEESGREEAQHVVRGCGDDLARCPDGRAETGRGSHRSTERLRQTRTPCEHHAQHPNECEQRGERAPPTSPQTAPQQLEVLATHRRCFRTPAQLAPGGWPGDKPAVVTCETHGRKVVGRGGRGQRG